MSERSERRAARPRVFIEVDQQTARFVILAFAIALLVMLAAVGEVYHLIQSGHAGRLKDEKTFACYLVRHTDAPGDAHDLRVKYGCPPVVAVDVEPAVQPSSPAPSKTPSPTVHKSVGNPQAVPPLRTPSARPSRNRASGHATASPPARIEPTVPKPTQSSPTSKPTTPQPSPTATRTPLLPIPGCTIELAGLKVC